MDESLPPETPRPLTVEERRDFLVRARKLAVGVPATVLLLQAATKPAHATSYGGGPGPTTSANVPSDRRLKADIQRLGALPNGIGVYSYRYTWSAERFIGVMADEVEAVMPAAVSVHASGYKMVDYAQVID